MTTDVAKMSPAAERYAEECLKLSADAAMHVRVLPNIVYGGDPRQRMDIFLPLDADLRDLPVLLFMHGGAWTHGTKDWCGFMAPPIVQLPAIFVSVGYRLIPNVSFPEPVMDCISALRWISDHIVEFGGSPKRLFVGGHSAGGQIAALMSLHKEWLVEAGLPADVIKGCFCLATTFNRRTVRPDVAPGHEQPGTTMDTAPDSPWPLRTEPRCHSSSPGVGATMSGWSGRDGR
jgi:acetyl esterase/lipase